MPTTAGPDGSVSRAAAQEREYTPAELNDLTQKIIDRSGNLGGRHAQQQSHIGTERYGRSAPRTAQPPCSSCRQGRRRSLPGRVPGWSPATQEPTVRSQRRTLIVRHSTTRWSGRATRDWFSGCTSTRVPPLAFNRVRK
ncbi:hypothetical protein GCM10009647_082450 [Streptomyces sanglieri]